MGLLARWRLGTFPMQKKKRNPPTSGTYLSRLVQTTSVTPFSRKNTSPLKYAGQFPPPPPPPPRWQGPDSGIWTGYFWPIFSHVPVRRSSSSARSRTLKRCARKSNLGERLRASVKPHRHFLSLHHQHVLSPPLPTQIMELAPQIKN